MISPLPPRLAAAMAAGLDHFSLAAVDWHGRLRAKQLNLTELPGAFDGGVAMTSAIFATDSAERPIETSRFQDPGNGYRDARLLADSSAIYGDAFGPSPESLLVLGSLVDEHRQFCPRAILERELAALTALGFTAFGAFEYEFHLLRETPDSLRTKVPAQLQRLPELSRMYSYVDQSLLAPLLNELRAAVKRAGVELESVHAEFSGLLEAALAPAADIAIADRAVVFKAIAKTLARQHGLLAVFMARVADDFESAGAHLNLSLRAHDQPCFVDENAADRLSLPLRHFIGGLQRYTPELTLLHLPYLNSSKRFAGASFAPQVNAWGIDNKTCAWRVVNASPALTRIECRLPGADVHPHLCLAAVLAAGRRGLEEGLLPTPAVAGDAARSPHQGAPFPLQFESALASWRESIYAREVFGDAFVEAFAESRDWQLALLRRTVTDFDLRQFGEGV
jgi:glutamine synthetase